MKIFRQILTVGIILLFSCNTDRKVKPAHTWILMQPAMEMVDTAANPIQLMSQGYLIMSADADTCVLYKLINQETGQPNNPDTLYSFKMNNGLRNMVQQLDLMAEKTPSNMYLDPLPRKDAIYCGTRYLLLQVQEKTIIKYFGLLDHMHNNILDTLLDNYRNNFSPVKLVPHANALEYSGILLQEYRTNPQLKPFFFPGKPKSRWKLEHVKTAS